MQAREAKLLDILKRAPQFQIPLYQRMYSWTERECNQLWSDIVRAGKDSAIQVHFMGSVVYVENGVGGITHHPGYLVIDGQQRLTTVTLLLAALASVTADSEPVDGFNAHKIKNYYLVNGLESGDRYHKLILSQTDKDTLNSIVDGVELPKDFSIRISENYNLFKKLLNENKADIGAVCHGLLKLVVVDIALTRGQDNPQLIFESMNSTGKELSQADLIRNYILMGLETELQSRLYTHYWRRMELDFGQEAYTTHFDAFMRHYLTVKTGEIPNINAVYDSFKRFSQSTKESGQTEAEHIESVVSDIRQYASYFCHIALGTEPDTELAVAFGDIRELRVDVVYPFLIELYKDYVDNTLSKENFIAILRIIESYVFRRAVCNIPTNSLNKTFAHFAKAVDKNNYVESVVAHLLLLPSYRRFPNNAEFFDAIQKRDLYNFRNRSYWLRRFENFDRRERVYINDYTIEHIMPQNENLSQAWREELGEEWERIHSTYLHTLGNLTLTGYNSEYSDKPFKDKRDMAGGFYDSPIALNRGIASVEKWNEQAILDRSVQLASKAIDVWGAPELSEETLAKYQPKKEARHEYSIEDHPYLVQGSEMYGSVTKDLFAELQKEILALDPVVTEEFLKHYVAYKAETNFVDVVPQASGLVLSLNTGASTIDDPRWLCRDVSEKGSLGNGNYEFKLTQISDIPYAVGLIRQCLEVQIADNE